MVNFKIVKSRDLWRQLPSEDYIQKKFDIFLEEIKDMEGRYFNNAVEVVNSLSDDLRMYAREFLNFLFNLELIHESITPREVWIDKNINAFDSHKDIVDVVNNEIDLKYFIRLKKLNRLNERSSTSHKR